MQTASSSLVQHRLELVLRLEDARSAFWKCGQSHWRPDDETVSAFAGWDLFSDRCVSGGARTEDRISGSERLTSADTGLAQSQHSVHLRAVTKQGAQRASPRSD